MIKAILVFNNFGKPRLIKFFQHYSVTDQQKIIKETFHLVSRRDPSVCNFLEAGSLIDEDFRLVYRHYATLFFVFCVDSSESELGILDLIQVFVESLDKCFENVCELDLIFHMDKVHHVLDEIVVGGLVLETNQAEIMQQIRNYNQLSKSETSTVSLMKGTISSAPNRASVAARNIKDSNIGEIPSKISFPKGFSIKKIRL